MSVDHVELHRLRGDLALRALSPAERDAVRELLVGSSVSTDRRALDAFHRLASLGLAVQHGGDEFSPSPLLIHLKHAGSLGEIGVR